MRYMVTCMTVGLLVTGCSLGPDSWVSVDGKQVWVAKSGFAAAPLTQQEAEWSRHLDVRLSKYYYRYQGPPALLHFWADINRNGQPVTAPVYSIILADRERPTAHVNMSGVVLISQRYEPSPEDKPAPLSICIDARECGTFKMRLPFEQRVFYSGEGHGCGEGRFELDQAKLLESFYFYTQDHEDYKRMTSKEGGSFTFDDVPGPGKTVLTFRTRITGFDPSLPLTAVRQNGCRGTHNIGPSSYGLMSAIYTTTDQRDPGFQASGILTTLPSGQGTSAPESHPAEGR